MSAIETYLQYIASKVWARDVRTAIVNAIRQCYDDVHNPTLNTEALQAAIQAKIDAGQMAALTIGDRTITAAKLALGVIPTPDTTLSQSGVPADAKKTGDEITEIKADLDDLEGALFSDTAKLELIECLKRVTWKDSDGETHFENLVEALGVAIVDYDILIGKNIAITTLSADPKDVQYFIDSTDNTKRALLFADTGDTGTHCMTLQDSTPTTYYPVKIPASVKKIWFDNAKENNFAVNIHIIYYDSTIGGYRRLLTGKVYDMHEIGNWKYDDGNGGIWKLDISDYNDGNLFMLGTFVKSHSSTIRTDSEGNQYAQAVHDNEDIDSAINNVVLRMI